MPMVHFHFSFNFDDSEYIKNTINSCHFGISVLDNLESL